MNNLKQVLTLIKEDKKELSTLYQQRERKVIKEALDICKFSGESSQITAVIKRIVELKEDPVIAELKKLNQDDEKIKVIRADLYKFVAKIYEKRFELLLKKIKDERLLDEFMTILLDGVHKIGLIMNEIHPKWLAQIEQNREKFNSMSDPYFFIKENSLYQKTPHGEICDRSYGVTKLSKNSAMVPYALFFKEEFKRLDESFKELIEKLTPIAATSEERAYIQYFKSLKAAFGQTDNSSIIAAWREAEMAWMEIKGALQVGHPLEYYEDNYTRSVAFEWDLRVEELSHFDESKFKKEIKNSFDRVYKKIDGTNKIMHSMVCSNIDKTQVFISTPMLFYGADLNGLFSAQVVPNDEFVSANSGKKIFAFINYVYESAKSRPYMKISSEIFEPDYLKFGRDILQNRAQIWKKVYEITTIGHEFGHLLFIDEESEFKMSESGVFKYIEEYKATTGGLVNFFFNEDREFRLAILDDVVRRSVGLIAWQKVNEVRAYYCEGLIHLTLLFRAKVLRFDGTKLKVDFTLRGYENFKKLALANYLLLAKIYHEKIDAWEFLRKFCTKVGDIYLPNDKDVKEFVIYYHDLYEKIGNEIEI